MRKPPRNQPPLFLQPAPGTDCGLQATDLGGQQFHQSTPTEATSEAAKILRAHAGLKVMTGDCYQVYVERTMQKSVIVDHYYTYQNEKKGGK